MLRKIRERVYEPGLENYRRQRRNDICEKTFEDVQNNNFLYGLCRPA